MSRGSVRYRYMKAVTITAPGKIQITEVPIPIPDADQVMIRMIAGSICGSDLRHLNAEHPVEYYPLRPGFTGHECVGVIEMGNTHKLKAGDPVLVLPPEFDGFSEYYVCDPRWLVPLPDDIRWQEIVLSQQLGTVLFCVRRLSSVASTNVVVLGQGPAGLLFDHWFRSQGANIIIGIDLLAHRLRVAREMGATHVIDASISDPVEAVRKLLPSGADIVVEAVGKQETINQVPDLVREQGHMVFYGIPPTGAITFRFQDFFKRYATTFTSARAQYEPGLASFRRAVSMIASREIDVRPMISHQFSISEVTQAFELAESYSGGVVKVILKFGSES